MTPEMKKLFSRNKRLARSIIDGVCDQIDKELIPGNGYVEDEWYDNRTDEEWQGKSVVDLCNLIAKEAKEKVRSILE